MSFWASSGFFQRSLNYLTSAVTHIAVCSTRPATPAEAWGSTLCLARSSAANVGAPASTTNGWTVPTTSHSGLTVRNAGAADHIALLATTATLVYVTMCSTVSLTTSDTVSLPSFNVRISDPTSS